MKKNTFRMLLKREQKPSKAQRGISQMIIVVVGVVTEVFTATRCIAMQRRAVCGSWSGFVVAHTVLSSALLST